MIVRVVHEMRRWQLMITLVMAGLWIALAAPTGAEWSNPFGAGVGNTVYAMVLNGNGDLYVGGYFTLAGGVTTNYIAKKVKFMPFGSINHALERQIHNRIYNPDMKEINLLFCLNRGLAAPEFARGYPADNGLGFLPIA